MYRLLMVGILGISLMFMTACESMTGKTAGQSIDDATVTAWVQAKLTGDKAVEFFADRCGYQSEYCHAKRCGPIHGREIAGRKTHAAGEWGDESEQQPTNSVVHE